MRDYSLFLSLFFFFSFSYHSFSLSYFLFLKVMILKKLLLMQCGFDPFFSYISFFEIRFILLLFFLSFLILKLFSFSLGCGFKLYWFSRFPFLCFFFFLFYSWFCLCNGFLELLTGIIFFFVTIKRFTDLSLIFLMISFA